MVSMLLIPAGASESRKRGLCCLIMLWSHWCRGNELGPEWPLQHFCNGKKSVVCKHSGPAALWLWLSPPLSVGPAREPQTFPWPLVAATFISASLFWEVAVGKWVGQRKRRAVSMSRSSSWGQACRPAPFWDCYLGDAGCWGRTATELVNMQTELLLRKVNAAGLPNYSKKKKRGVCEMDGHQARWGAATDGSLLL